MPTLARDTSFVYSLKCPLANEPKGTLRLHGIMVILMLRFGWGCWVQIVLLEIIRAPARREMAATLYRPRRRLYNFQNESADVSGEAMGNQGFNFGLRIETM